jgi:hypothetical protein
MARLNGGLFYRDRGQLRLMNFSEAEFMQYRK